MKTPASTIRLVVTDIDGTLVDPDKRVTPRAQQAVARLAERGIRLALISARPPRGLDALMRTLALDTPRAGFNGGEITGSDGSVLDQLLIAETPARLAIEMLETHGIDAWVFADDEWFVTNPAGAYVPLERRTVGIEPTVVPDFEGVIGRAGKIMGATADYAKLARVEIEMQSALAGSVAAHRSQDYYLDVTHPSARKDHGLRRLASLMGVPVDETACLGDMGNDIPMLAIAGLSIAMGNATEEVQSHAMFTTGSNRSDGWAEAIETLVLPRAPQPH